MKYKEFLLFTITFILTSNLILAKRQTNPPQNNFFNIRVLLYEGNSKKKSIFEVESNSNILVSSPHTKRKLLIKAKKVWLAIKNNRIYLSIQDEKSNRRKTKKVKSTEIKIVPTKTDNLTINKKTYQGNFTVKIDKKKKALFLINNLNLDDYLYSVLVSESYQTWPLEMQKVQAVISRSYAIHCMTITRRNEKNKRPYDLKRSNFHQTYNGTHKYTHLRQAINKTKNLILTHSDEVVLAMFDACCGGIIPANIKGVDFDKAPYLARKQRCTFCKNYNLYHWRRTISPRILFEKLRSNPTIHKKFKKAGYLKNIYVSQKDKAGIAHKIKVVCSRKKFSITSTNLWKNLRNKIKSLNFTIHKTKKSVIFEGNGFGHQIGLCQRGARELVRHGWNFKKILNFYYPGTRFARLKKYA